MKNLAKLVCIGTLLALTATSCTKTDLEEENKEQVNYATEGEDEKVKVPPRDD